MEARNFSEGSKAKVLSFLPSFLVPIRAVFYQGRAVIFHLREHRTRAPLGARPARVGPRSRSVMMTANGRDEEEALDSRLGERPRTRRRADREKLRRAGTRRERRKYQLGRGRETE